MSVFPEWIEDFRVEDDLFADGYEKTGPQLRAWLKKTIAQIYGVNSPGAPLRTWTVNTWRGGFETEISQAPVDWTVLLFEKDCVSPVRMLASLVPAMAAGVANILAVFCGEGEIPGSLLAGFELAGQEDVVCLQEEQVGILLQELVSAGNCGAVLDLRGRPGKVMYSPSVRYWRAPDISSICVCKDEESPDMGVLEFAHPDVEFIEVDQDDMSEASADAAVVPAELVGEGLTSFRIVLAHGQEGCWIWNGFGSDFFKQESVALAAAE